MIIQNKYDIGDIVYLKTEPEQYMRIIVEIIVTRNEVLYAVMCGESQSNHYEFELSGEKLVEN